MFKFNIGFCLLLVNFSLSFSSGDQTVPHDGRNEDEAENQLEGKGNNDNFEEKYCWKEVSLTLNNGPQIEAQTQVDSFPCGDQTVPRTGGNMGEAGNQLEGNNVNSEQGDSWKEVYMIPDREPKIGPQTPEKIQTDTDKHSESTANTHDLISGHISKESQEPGNVEISRKRPIKDSIKIISKNKYDKESEVRDNPVSIGKRDKESLLPAVTGGEQRLCKQPGGFFFYKEPVSLTCQPLIKGTEEENKFKSASIEENKIKQKPDVSNEEASAPKQQKRKKVNYACKLCGATIEENNAEADNVNFIITSNKDEYLVNPCAARKKWFVIELCERIYVKEIKTGSFELFSSQPQNISVAVSDRYPAKIYHSLGVFQLTESRKLHKFEIKKGHNIPVKYVKVEMLTHYGKEHYCPLTFFKVYGIPVKLNTNDGDQEWKQSWDNTEDSENEEGTVPNQSRDLFTLIDVFTKFLKDFLSLSDADELYSNDSKPLNVDASYSEKIEPSEPTAEKTNAGSNSLVVVAVVVFFVLTVVVLFACARTPTLQSREEFDLNDQSQKRATVETLAERPESLLPKFGSTSGNRCSSRDTLPNVTDLEITRFVKEKYDILLLYADEDRHSAMELRQQLIQNSISDTCTQFLNVILIEEFVPEVQSKLLTIEYVFERCKYLFVLVTSNLKKDPLKRYQGQLALINSIENDFDRVIPIWAEHEADKFVFEFTVLKGIHFTLQKPIDFGVIKRLFNSA